MYRRSIYNKIFIYFILIDTVSERTLQTNSLRFRFARKEIVRIPIMRLTNEKAKVPNSGQCLKKACKSY